MAGSARRPLWSVMIPSHNCEQYLRETLASVLAQDPGPDRMQIEVVDASSDDPRSVVDELGRGRVGFFRRSPNVGHVANFNACLERSCGRLVHRLHGDDCVADGFYAARERLREREVEAGAAFCRHVIKINREHLTPERAAALTRRALRETATTCLRRARRALGRRDTATAWAQLREPARLVPSLVRRGSPPA